MPSMCFVVVQLLCRFSAEFDGVRGEDTQQDISGGVLPGHKELSFPSAPVDEAFGWHVSSSVTEDAIQFANYLTVKTAIEYYPKTPVVSSLCVIGSLGFLFHVLEDGAQ